MSKTKKLSIAFGIMCAVGITYAVTALKGFPEVFEIEGEDDET